ncbi:MAG: glycosyltransferase family 1 protein [Promethearchaeota archaeon]|nr:MAG: glycosyltransferase family 1 protein [Candidatus Lokiarchaeota archaeon]
MSNILILPTRYYPSISGAEFYIQRIAEILKTVYNYNVDIITSNALDFRALRNSRGKIIGKDNAFFSKVNDQDIYRLSIEYNDNIEKKMDIVKKNLLDVNLELTDECLKRYLENGPFLKSIFETIRNDFQKNYDLIHTTFFPYFNLIVGLWAGKLFKKPVVCTPFFHFSNPRYLNPYLTEALKKFDMLIACTKIEKDFLVKNYAILDKKVRVIPMGVDLNKFNQKKGDSNSKYYFKQSYFHKKEKKFSMVLFCGYKNYEKGALSILKAIPLIIQKKPKVYFTFIGPSTLAFNRELKNLKKHHNVRIINLTPDNLKGYYDLKKIAAFNETNLFLMPSRSDAYGIAFLEAWASSKPVIGSNKGATPEVINDGVDGMLVKFDDPHDISEKVIKLLRNKKMSKKLGKAGYFKVKRSNSWEHIAKSTHKLYQEIINNCTSEI